MDRQQESVDLESARGGVRRPRSEAARRPRPQSRFLSALTDSKPSASHPSDGSYREVVDEETVDAEAQEKSANDRTRESDADVMGVDVGVVRREVLSGKTEDGKDIRLYSRKGGKDHKQQDGLQSTRYEARGDRDEYKAGRDQSWAGRDDGRVRKDDGKSSRDEVRGVGSYDGKGGRFEGRAGIDEGRFSLRGDYKGSRFSERESETERRNNRNEAGRYEDRGEWRNGNGRPGVSKPEVERMKRPEKSMKEIVEREKHLKENGEKFKGQRIHGNEKDKVGWSKERDGRVRDAGAERGDRNRNQTVQNGSREGRVGSEIKPKSAERFLPEQKQFVPTKLKLKVGGITHTLVSDSMKKKPVPSTALEIQVPLKALEPDDAGKNKKRRHRLILQDSDEEDEMTEPQFDYPPLKAQKKDIDIAHSPSFRPRPQMREGGVDHSSPSGRFIGQSRAKPLFEPKVISESPSLAVRKSSRIPKRRVLDGDEEESEDANLTQRPLSHGRGVRRVEEEIEQEEGQQPEEEDSEDEDLTEKASGLISDDEDLEDLEEEDDEEVAGRAKRAKVQQLHGSGSKGKPSTGTALTARQRSMQSSKEADGDAVLSLIEFPGGLASPLGRKGKGKLSEAERQVKRADAARRRKQQVEKAAIEIQATAIQKILGQDSTRKRREDRLQKRRQEIEQEKKMAELVPATNSIRWSLGPSGTVVSFAEDVGLPNLFNTGPCRYPPAREKCYAPSCPNTYKYRDSKSKVPLCSLECYKVVHAIAST